MNQLENTYFTHEDDISISRNCSHSYTDLEKIHYDEPIHEHSWPDNFARLRKMWSHHSKFSNTLHTIPVYQCSSRQRVAVTSPRKMKKILNFMFPTDSIDPNEWQLQLVKKDNTQILPIFDDLCSLDKVNKCTEDAGKVAVESRQKEKKMKKGDDVKPLQTYTQYVEISPEPCAVTIPEPVKGTTQKKNLPPQAVRDIKKPSQLQNNIKKYDTKNQKLKKAEANLALKKQRDHLTAGQTCKKTILPAKCEGKKVEVSQKPVTCQFEKGDSLHVPQNSFASLGENVEKCHPMNLPKKSCHYCKTIFEFLEKKSKDPDCEPPKEYLQRVDDCPLCCKFLEFLKLQCKTCCGKCRSKFDHCCGCNRSADKQRPKTESKAHRPKLTIEQIKAIEMKENKIIYDKIFNKPRPKTAEGSCRKSPSRNNRQTQIPIVSPVEENVRRNLEKLLKQISEMSNNETKRSKINSQAEIEERVKPLKLSETCTDVTDASSYMSADDAFINANGETFCPSDCLCQRQRNSEKQHRCIQVAPIPPPVDFEWTVKPCRTTRKNSFETKRPYTAIDKTQHRQLIEELDSYHACRNSKLNTSFYEEELYSDYSGSILSNN